MKLEILLSFVIVLIGLFGLSTSKGIIKTIISLNITQAAIILLFLSIGATEGGEIPILNGIAEKIVDPIPQALMITTIVIGASITALSLMLAIKVFHYYGTLSWKELFDREG
ncbi:NADH-quinone oxidoreductase subunit K [Senegalia massiliensis]|uniref:Sodium:proton antiporter n=1 Tax=Senegalia massiliensis TaxID=1720316 RepID=A0A845QVN6_9CLOT|nr:sodium:proton antiporter [Senegalia massiliensis]